MGELKFIWNLIQSDVEEGNSRAEVVAESFLYPWNHDNHNMDMICKALSLLKPEVVIEIGTFEGFGTLKMAQALNGFGTIYTIDGGKAPFNSLGETYGVTKDKLIDGEFVDWQNIEGKFSQGWSSWGKVMKQRELNLKKANEITEVNFVEGLSWDVLPKLFDEIKTGWDFMYHDGAHDIDNVLKDWKTINKFSKKGSIIVFDDFYEGYSTLDYFTKEEALAWEWTHVKKGHQPLWGERIK